jgi:membrane-bound lytic murein transglycosylase D
MPLPTLFRPLSSCAFAGLLLLYAAGVRAEAPSFHSTWSQEVLSGVPQEVESPELKALRLAEEELFGSAEVENTRAAETPADAVLEAPPASMELQGKRVDLGFLKGLELPGLPVRWDRRVIEYLVFFKEDPRGRELAAGWLKRRERFGSMIRRVLEENGLPTDLQYVAMIESGYEPTARSQVDAWGMWQFMQQPGSSYGLRIDRWVDERLDPERSTRAAARFMRDLYDRFGSWELSFAAYNMGYGGLLRAIKKYNSNDYWLLSHLEAGLPFETSLYVSKITAMAIVARNPERFGFKDVVAERPRLMAKVDVAPGTALEELAQAAAISVDELKKFNPHLKQSRTPPGEDVQVYVPRESQVHFAQRWAARKNDAGLVPYTVRLGEGLEELARRAETSVDSLRALNELAQDERVKPGFTLFVPAHAKPTRDLVEPLVATVPPREFAYAGKKRVFYRVGPDDDASKVAQFFEVTLQDLVSWNSLTPSASLQPGMLLQMFVSPEVDLSQAVVYTPQEVRILALGSDEFFAYHEAQRGRERVRYRVQPGDTLTALGQRFDLTPGSLGRINQFPSDRELKAGESLVIYVPREDVATLGARGLIAPLHEGEAPRSVALAERASEPGASEAPTPQAAGTWASPGVLLSTRKLDDAGKPATPKTARASGAAPVEAGERTWGGQLMEPRSKRDGSDQRVSLVPAREQPAEPSPRRERVLASALAAPLRAVRPPAVQLTPAPAQTERPVQAPARKVNNGASSKSKKLGPDMSTP